MVPSPPALTKYRIEAIAFDVTSDALIVRRNWSLVAHIFNGKSILG